MAATGSPNVYELGFSATSGQLADKYEKAG